jgi:hypothetical protein
VQIPCTKGGNQKKITLQGANKKKLHGGKKKLAHITGDINLFTHNNNIFRSRIKYKNMRLH